MDGILVVDKPQGFTSHDVVDFMRKRFGLPKVGHAGTLDPMATGVLVILIGSNTRSSDTLMGEDKEYEATLVLGGVSDTGDAWGIIKDCGKNVSFRREELERVFKKFIGTLEQVPPMYSAIKIKGRKLYELARKGIKVDIKPRRIFIEKIDLLDISVPRVSFKLTCSKGTYIRQLCVDIGEELGCGAYLSRLVRTRSGRFSICQAVTVDELRGMGNAELENRLVSI